MAKVKTKTTTNQWTDSEDLGPILRLLQLVVAALSVAIALAVTRLLPGSSERPSLIILFAAVLVSAWTGGRKPAWLAIALSVAGIAQMAAPALDPETISGKTHVAWLAAFLITALIMAEVICQMRSAQYQLQEHNRRLMLAQQVSKIWFWNLDLRTGRIGVVARPGASESKPQNQTNFDTLVADQVHPEDRNRVHEALTTAVENRSPYVVEYRILDDQEVRWIASRGTVFMDQGGNPVSIIGMSADITEHKTAEENRVRGDVLLNSIVEGVIYLSAQGKLIYLNAAAERLLGFRSTEVCGKSMHELIHGKHPYGIEGDTCPIIDVVNTGTPYRNADDYFQRRDGTFLNVEYTSAPLSLDGAKTGAVVTFRDIGEHKRAEQVLHNSERLAVTGRIAATISHEINNPLESVSNLLYLIGHTEGLSAAGRAYLEMAEQELARMAQIVKQTLSFSRESTVPVPVKLTELIDGILLLYERKLVAKKIKIVRRFDYHDEIRAFPGEMRQVFSNLIVNAAEAMEDQGLLRIHIRSSRDWRSSFKRGVRVTVMDTGGGISRETRRRLFQPFFTTKGEKGTGIGLWVSNEIVKRHSGAITVHSSTRKGHSYTAFSVFIPVTAVIPIRRAKDEFAEKAA